MIFSSSDILTTAQLKKITTHKYKACGTTLLDSRLQPFWNWIVLRFPLWLAPNLMTITGLFINIITSSILLYYSPNAREEVPRWAFMMNAFGLLVYQTLDACDGKQARRTNSNSPLGELFDHGCDALSTVFLALGVCIAVQLGAYPVWMFFQCFTAIALFYCAHWQTYVSGTLRFVKFDVTEVQLSIITVYLVSALFGPSIWMYPIPYLGVELRLLPALLALVVTTVMLYSNFHIILSGGVGKNGSTVAGTSVLSPFIPLALVVLPAFTIYQKSPSHLYENHPCLYILTFGLCLVKIIIRLVIAHMTKSELDYFDSVLLGPTLLFFNQYFNTFLDEYLVLWIALVYALADLIHYCHIVCRQICHHLQIHLFTLPARNLPKGRH